MTPQTKPINLLLIALLITTAALAQDAAPAPPEARPTIKYIVATPRACLLPNHLTEEGEIRPGPAAANNFPRAHGSIRVPLGTNVLFALSRRTEGVWYQHSLGLLGTSLRLEVANPNADPCDPCTPQWIPIGRAAARDVRHGPSIGVANVKVRAAFNRPGPHHLRALIHTIAQPYLPNPDNTDPTDAPPLPHPAFDRDIVHINVIVLDAAPADINHDDLAPNPDAFYTQPLIRENDPDDQDLEADLNADTTVNMLDLAVMASQWGDQLPPPIDDDPQ